MDSLPCPAPACPCAMRRIEKRARGPNNGVLPRRRPVRARRSGSHGVPMPIYEFECSQCGHRFDRLQKLSDADPADCPECGAPKVHRRVSAPSFRLAGGGWYETDFKKDGDKKRNLADKGDGPKTEAKPAAESAAPKTEPKPAADAAKPKDSPAAAVARMWLE